MSSDLKTRPTRVAEPGLFYTAESLRFARSLLSDLEDKLKEKAMQLTCEAGRDTVTEEDMRRAADVILGESDLDDQGSDDA